MQTAKILHNHYKIYNNYNYYINEKTLQTLPGIGEYTARAILCFAFNKQVAVVDTNVRRVILTQFQISNVKSQIPNKKKIQEIADQLLPRKALRLRSGRLLSASAYEWNQALMDYSAMVLKKEKILPQSGIMFRKTKQTKFIGSNRYYRGKIITLLVEKERVEQKVFMSLFAISPEQLQKIIDSLLRDGLIRVTHGTITLAQ